MFIEVLTSSKARNQHKRLKNETNAFVYFGQLSIMGLNLRLSVCMSCKPNSTVLHTITDGDRSIGGTRPPKLNLVDNRRLL